MSLDSNVKSCPKGAPSLGGRLTREESFTGADKRETPYATTASLDG